MRLLVTGCRGQLGRALESVAAARGHEPFGVDLPELDITDAAAVRAVVAAARPDAIVNCAAFTAVDLAETQEGAALAVNGTAVGHLAESANLAGAVLVQVSTDYVFAGDSSRPYRESDPPAPVSAYGRTKLVGELAAATARRHLIARTAWLFGEGGVNFVEAIRRQLDAGRSELRVVDDQRGSPTYARDLAVGLVELVEHGAEGTFHAVNDGSATWFDFACEIVRVLGARATVEPVTTAAFPRPAPRPGNSVLDTSRLRSALGHGLPSWQDALSRYLLHPAR